LTPRSSAGRSTIADPPTFDLQYHQGLAENSKPSAADSALAALFSSRRAVLALFATLTVVLTAPLAFRWTTHLPAGAGDVYQNHWNYWWWKKALLDLGQSPYHTDYLFHPFGTDLIFYTHSSFNMLVSMPINYWLGETAAYNFSTFLALTLSGYGAYLLVREITGDVRAGVLGGLVFAFFPQHVEQTIEHLNLSAVQFLPWAVYYFIRMARDGGVRNALGLGVTFALNALCSWHLGLFLSLTLVPLALWRLAKPQRPRLQTVALLVLAALTATALLWPLVGPLITEMASGVDYYQKDRKNNGLDSAFLLIPHDEHPILGWLTYEKYAEDRAYGASGFICFLGFTTLVMSFLAVRRGAAGAKYWLGFSIVALLLAIGSPVWWNGESIEGLPLPFEITRNAPLLSVLNVANRFLILTSMGLAILVGMGWTRLAKQTDRRFLLIGGLLFFEYLWIPYPIRELAVSPAYHEMLDDPILRIGAVLDIPFHRRANTVRNMRAQTVHGRPIGGGYLSMMTPDTQAKIDAEPALASLQGKSKYDQPIDFRRLIQLGFDTVVLHKYRADSVKEQRVAAVEGGRLLDIKYAKRTGGIPDETMADLRRQLEEHNGPAAFEDDEVAIFYLRPAQGRSDPSEPRQ